MRQALLRILTVFACACLPVLAAHAAPVALDPPDIAPGSSIAATSLVQIDVIAGVSGAPNGFTIQWMSKTTFDALGGWPADETDPAIQSAIYLGTPTLNTVDGTTTFLLAPGQLANVQIGDIFDETGVQSVNRSELSSGTVYVFRVKANGDPGVSTGGGTSLQGASTYSPTMSYETKTHSDLQDCVHTQGYWKNHPNAWPVSAVKLGNVIYTEAQLLQIFNTPAAGNGLISLAHQLIAAKLNLAAGAVPTTTVLGAISTSDALIGNKIVPPIGAGFLSPGTTSHLTDDLEEFNSDEGNQHACQISVPTNARSWGQVKAMYR